MNFLHRLRFVAIAAAFAGFMLSSRAATLASNGSFADVQAKISAAHDGDVVTLPAGSFTWTSGITISGKGIHLQGAGSGRVIGRSKTSVAVGTGAKTFATQAGLNISPGQTLRIERTGGVQLLGNPTGARAYMVGSVTSYSGTTLVMNITSIGGAGTHPLWIISTAPATTITRALSNGPLIGATEDTSHHVEISGIYFAYGSGTGNCINVYPVGSGRPVQVHDCYAEIVYTGDNSIFLHSESIHGLVYNCSFIGAPISNGGQAIMVKANSSAYNTWILPSTMGTADTTGTLNFYIEDCDFHGMQNSMDMTDNARTVVRHCLFNNAAIGSHGTDSSYYGLRHLEIYDNEFLFDGYNDGQTMNIVYSVYYRGGTGVITDNVLVDLNSQDYGNKTEIILQIQNLARNAGPDALWSDNDGGRIEYPCPRQVGMGRVTGTGVDGHGRHTDPSPGQGWPGTYVGDSEPLYIWGNSGAYAVGVNTGMEGGGGQAISPDPASAYIVAGRDYFNNGTAKPGWTKPTGSHPAAYPHPSRTSDAAPTAVIPPTYVRINKEP